MSTATLDQGIALLDQHKFAAAAEVFKTITDVAPEDALAHAGLGRCLIALQREDEAWQSLRTACQLSDRIAIACTDLAWLAMKRGDEVTAKRAATQAVVLNRYDASSRFVLAQLAFAQAHFDDAEAGFSFAAESHPNYVEARNNLGNLAFAAKDFSAAMRHYSAYAQLRPQDATAWVNAGLSALRANQSAAARTALEKAVTLAPDQAKPITLLAAALQQSGASSADIIPVLTRALELNPAAADMHVQLACSHFDEFSLAQGKASLKRALALEPLNLTARWLDFQIPDAVVAPNAAFAEAFLTRWRQGIAFFETLDFSDPKIGAQARWVVLSATNFYLAYVGQPLVEEYARNGAILNRLATFAFAPIDHAYRATHTARKKIAVVSASLNAHSVSLMWSTTLLGLDRNQFEISAFYLGVYEDISTKRWRAQAASFHAGPRTLENWIEAVRAFGPDIVVFPDIGMDRNTHALAALRHAPVQVATWGHPVTSGLQTIDYFLGADACEPDDAASHYTEQLIRLPRLGVYLDLPDAVEPPQLKSDDSGFRFVCTQSAYKLHPAHDVLFARILAASPAARLDILCSMTETIATQLADRMRPIFAEHDVDFDARCSVHPRLANNAYQTFLAQADASLDSLDFSGCVTSLDALWRNLPVVTLPGKLMRGRQTFAMLKLMQLDELIATDQDDYVRIAARLAQDTLWHQTLTNQIIARKSALYADQGAIDALAQFLQSVPSRTKPN